MQFVVDTNILLFALIRDSKTRLILFHPSLEFFLPEYALDEIRKHRQTIAVKSGLSDNDIDLLLDLFLERTIVVPKSSFADFIPRAVKIMKNIDINDVPFIALALSFQNDGIWTQDKDFQRQKTVRVWTTSDILQLLVDHRLF